MLKELEMSSAEFWRWWIRTSPQTSRAKLRWAEFYKLAKENERMCAEG